MLSYLYHCFFSPPQRPSSKVNLKAALEKRASIKSVEATPTGSTQHYRLPTKGATMAEAKVTLDRRAGGSESESDDESIDQAQPEEFTKTTAQKKLEATLVASRQEVGGVSPAHSSPVDVDVAVAPQPMEKIGGNLPQIPGGGKATSAFSLSPKKSEDSELKKATPTRGGISDYDNDFDSDGSDVDAIPEEMSDIESEGEGEGSEEEDEPAGYNPWMSFGTASSSPGSRRTSPLTSPFTSPTHNGGLHGNYQTPTKMAISPLTQSIRSNHSMTPPPSRTELVATKTPSTSVDVGGNEQQLLREQEKEGEKDSDNLPGVSSSATDQVDEEGQHLTGEKEPAGERGADLNVCLSSATDQPSFSSQQGNKDEKESILTGIPSSSTDQESGVAVAAGGLASSLSSATDQEKGASLSSYPSSATDHPLKKGASLPSTLSSATDQPLQRGAGLPASLSSATDQLLKKGASFAVDQPLKKGTSLDSYAMDQSFKKEAGLSSSLSSSTDQPLKKGSFAVDQPLKKGASLDHYLSSSTDQPLKKGEKVSHGASLMSFPSSATDPPPFPSHVAAASSTKPEARSTGVHRDDSLEGLLTVDEELTDSDDDDDSYDYVEEIISTLAYVPSDPAATPKRRGGAVQPQSSEEKVRFKPDMSSPLQLSLEAEKLSATSLTPQQTPTKAKSSTPLQQVATPISDSSLVPVSPLSAGIAMSEFSEAKNASTTEAMAREELDGLSDILKSDDEDDDEIEKLLGEAEELSPKKMSAVDKKDASELFASVIKAAEEREMAEKKTVRDAVSDRQQVKGEPSPQKQEDVLDIEAQYEDSEWDSEEEESDGESDNEEEGGGTALAWLSNAGLADPFLSPLTSPTHSTPPSPRKAKSESQEEESKITAITTGLDAAVTSNAADSSKEREEERERKEREMDEPGHPLVRKVTTTHLPVDEGEKKGEREAGLQVQPSTTAAAVVVEPSQPLVHNKTTATHPPERKGERGDSVQLTEAIATVTESGHPLERKETVTHLPESKEKEKREGVAREEPESMQPTEGGNELGHPLVRKETVTRLPEKKEGEKGKRESAHATVAAVVEPGHPLIRKETLTHLPKDKGGVGDSIQATTAAGIHNELGHPLERKDTLTHLPDKEEGKDRERNRRDEVNLMQLTATDNELGHPLERKTTVTHLPEKEVLQQPRIPGLAVSPGRQTTVNKPVGVVGGSGLVGRVTDGDDTEDDATAFTNTESEVRKQLKTNC